MCGRYAGGVRVLGLRVVVQHGGPHVPPLPRGLRELLLGLRRGRHLPLARVEEKVLLHRLEEPLLLLRLQRLHLEQPLQRLLLLQVRLPYDVSRAQLLGGTGLLLGVLLG